MASSFRASIKAKWGRRPSVFRSRQQQETLAVVKPTPRSTDDDSDGLQSPGPMIKDQEHLVKDLKKENFDLKLRLYMEQKNNESSGGQIGEYETQLTTLLDKLEETARFAEEKEKETKELRMREKTLLTKYKRLEQKCNEQEHELSQMSQDLSKALSQSMHNVYHTEIKYSTPVRPTRSEYNVSIPIQEPDRESESEGEDTNTRSKAISPIQPFRSSSFTARGGDSPECVDRSDDRASRHKTGSRSLPRTHNTHVVSTPVSNFYKYEITDGAGNKPRSRNEDNIGVVRPNNSRADMDTAMNLYVMSTPEETQEKKKKKKGFWRVFKMCGGKSDLKRQNTTVYQKRESPKARPIESTSMPAPIHAQDQHYL